MHPHNAQKRRVCFSWDAFPRASHLELQGKKGMQVLELLHLPFIRIVVFLDPSLLLPQHLLVFGLDADLILQHVSVT